MNSTFRKKRIKTDFHVILIRLNSTLVKNVLEPYFLRSSRKLSLIRFYFVPKRPFNTLESYRSKKVFFSRATDKVINFFYYLGEIMISTSSKDSLYFFSANNDGFLFLFIFFFFAAYKKKKSFENTLFCEYCIKENIKSFLNFFSDLSNLKLTLVTAWSWKLIGIQTVNMQICFLQAAYSYFYQAIIIYPDKNGIFLIYL